MSGCGMLIRSSIMTALVAGCEGSADAPVTPEASSADEDQEAAPIVCPVGQLPCGDTCYEPFYANCFPGGIVCPSGDQLCESECYDPFYANCFPGGLVCPSGWQVCEGKCYHPSYSTCW
jgi:hypothetical protein